MWFERMKSPTGEGEYAGHGGRRKDLPFFKRGAQQHTFPWILKLALANVTPTLLAHLDEATSLRFTNIRSPLS